MAQSITLRDSRSIRLNRIRTVSRAMALICGTTSVLLSVAMALYWATTATPVLFTHAGMPYFPSEDLDLGGRFFAFVISMMPLGAFVCGLLIARRCFAAFARGEVFADRPIRDLRLFAIAIAASALLKPVAGAALTVLLSLHMATGTKAVAVNIGSDTLIALIFAGTVAVIASVMSEALAIADENRQFV
ncbi:MAG: hypothetical protein CFE29_31845 [Bradyrhizobiaceae bacterium PARB1]|jgi:Protein of unknown function (DUF2975)|nr:MAG: hypothetical protein CFE29_31845 [Bradyrhizobiaceae bacterium PARB1]